MRYLLLILSTLLCMAFYNDSYAAYPIQVHTCQEPATVLPAPQTGINDKVNAAIQKLAKPLPDAKEGHADDGLIGAISFGLGIGGLALIIAAGALGLPFLLALGIGAGIGAIITGAMGFKKQNKGLAIAGFVLGIIDITVLLLIVLLIIALTNAFK